MKKADGPHRSRFVAKVIQMCSAPELRAATPPIQAFKYIFRQAAQDQPMSIMHVDVLWDCCYAKASTDIEDQQEGGAYVRDSQEGHVWHVRRSSTLAK